jgi:glycosidase
MQWDASTQAGFTTASNPWMRVNDNYTAINAAAQVDDPQSVYHCWRQVLEQRKALRDIFVYGDFALVDEPNERVFAYKRIAIDGKAALVACNFSSEQVEWDAGAQIKEVLVSPSGKSLYKVADGRITFGPYEAIAVLL